MAQNEPQRKETPPGPSPNSPSLLFEYQCTSSKFIRFGESNRIEKIDSVARIEPNRIETFWPELECSSTKAKGKSMPATKAPTKVKNSKKTRQEQVDSDTDEVFCLICSEPYSNSRPREKWVRCVECCLWAHEECTAGSSPFICQNCDSDDDVN